jgi:NADPH:quinone reductase-like Zn-dependent oxidoreductase
MRALMTTSGPEAEVELVDLPDPHPAAGQLRIRMVGAGVNAADLNIIDGWGRESADGEAPPPLGLGLDVAGVVDLVGAGVDGFAPGTPVAALTFPNAPHSVAGAAAEYVIVPAEHAAPVPDGLDLLDAATLPVNTLTVAQLLPRLGRPQGRRLLVTGAAGGLGGFAVALAARAGWTVIALARESDAAFLTRAGGTELITAVKRATDVDAVFDAALLNEDALAPVRDHGSYLGVFPGREPAAERGITVEAGVVAPDGALLRELLVLAAQGTLESRRAGTLPLTDAAVAYRALRAGGQRGRWVLTP